MVPGVYTDISNADYHGGDGVNKGLLDVVHRSPLHAKALLDSANDNPPTVAQLFGTAFHTLLLEPQKFAEQYVCELTRDDAPDAVDDREELVELVKLVNADRLPKLATGGTKPEQVQRILDACGEQDSPRHTREELESMKGADLKALLEELNRDRPGHFSTSGNRHELAEILRGQGMKITLWSDVRARWDAENEGYTVLSADMFEQLLAMAHAVKSHPGASALLSGCEGIAEASVYAIDPKTGELRRCRPDWWRKDGVIVDLKTTIDASPEGFAKSLVNYRYHTQAPWYLDTMQLAYDAGHWPLTNENDGEKLPTRWAPPKAFAFIAVEKSAPYAVSVYVLDNETIELGRAEYRADLDTLAECRRTGVWPGYGDTLQMIGVPQWYLMRHAHQISA